MDHKEKLNWTRLQANLDLLTVSQPSTLVPIISEILETLFDQDRCSTTLRKINFLSYEIQSRCDELTERDRWQVLNEFFFHEKLFSMSSFSKNTIASIDWTFHDFLETKKTSSLLLSILYCHFSQQIDLPIYLVESNKDILLKWVTGTGEEYISMAHQGQKVTDSELCKIVSDEQTNGEFSLEIMPPKAVLDKYLKYLFRVFEGEKSEHHKLQTLNIQLKLNPADVQLISKRALLHKNLGNINDATKDFKRYFSLQGEDNAPSAIKLAFLEIKNFEIFGSSTIH